MAILTCPDCDVQWGRKFGFTAADCWMCGRPSGVLAGGADVDVQPLSSV